jgi:hypothetical protein
LQRWSIEEISGVKVYNLVVGSKEKQRLVKYTEAHLPKSYRDEIEGKKEEVKSEQIAASDVVSVADVPALIVVE